MELYESSVLQRSVGPVENTAPSPDETTVCRFRHPLEIHDLCGMMLDAVNFHLEAKRIKMATGTIADETVFHGPSQTKTSTGTHYP